MCIIVYKPSKKEFPKKETLYNCFDRNPDGAGYMFPFDNKVQIRKGFDTFDKFYKSLEKDKKKYGDKIPYILHFRISTQAHGRLDCTHPFPLSSNMDDLRKLNTTCDIGIAHNGIIDLTSVGYGYGYTKQITYSDTMLFITDYLSLIIKDRNYYKDKDKMLLIERLCDSKLAIMDGNGHTELVGDGWVEDKGIYYSNSTYMKLQEPKQTKKPKVISSSYYDKYYYGLYDDYDYYDANREYFEDYFEERKDEEDDMYDFDSMDCPMSYQEVVDAVGTDEIFDNYCLSCKNYCNCYPAETETKDEDNGK